MSNPNPTPLGAKRHTGKSKPKWRRNQEAYDALLASYRLAPGDHERAASCVVGCSAHSAKVAYDKGWPDLPGGVAISAQLALEMREARRRDRELLDAELEARKKKAKEAREREDVLVENASMAVHRLALSVLGISNTLAPLITEFANDVKAGNIKGKEAFRYLAAFPLMVQRATNVAQTMLQISRLDRGAPTEIVETFPAEAESAEEIRACQEILAGFERRREREERGLIPGYHRLKKDQAGQGDPPDPVH